MTTPNEPLPDFSDVQSGSSSEAMSQEEATERTYTVVKGDTLARIAKHLYGDASKWHAIYDANKDIIKNPDLIHIGWVLRVPEL
ncbi:MAG TPA: LysM peptidoglycan-binding domain-containing protein [Gemmatimonadaceae bacterium]|nr:LysM peptidoglycan-binding domain-containing protein [Gemmatimonadaceae bacterium]